MIPVAAPPMIVLPELRQDLRLVGHSTDLAGNTLWKIYDPVRHRYVAISNKVFAMLDVWQHVSSAEEIVEVCWRRHAEIVSLSDVSDLVTFLLESGLALPIAPDGWRRAFISAEKYKSARMNRLLHNYLFFRVPLVDPHRFLRATLPFVRPLGSWAAAIVFICIAMTAFYFVSREWEQFKNSAAALLSLSGISGVLVAIGLVKILHELGHGYVAVHYGCRVPVLGVAFILGAPLLFVDVTDGWKLRSTRERIAIDAAGIAVDLCVSAVALMVWVFLPDGGLRDIAFTLATVGWATSLAINLNPFMKFDGYHIVADAVSMPNLQERSIMLARWQLRRSLFGIDVPPPELAPPNIRRWLVIYGWGLWVFRAILFTGIALAVYHYFFKALGIILFLVEIGYFLIGPIWSEIREWAKMRNEIVKGKRFWATTAVVCIAVVALLIPWSTTVWVPAVLEANETARLHISVPARIVSINTSAGAQVSIGAPLVKLASADLDHQLKIAKLKKNIVDMRLARLAGTPADREAALVLQQEQEALERAAAGIRQRISELDVIAPIAGTVASLVENAAPGRWVSPSEPLAILDGKVGARIRGLVDAGDISRVRQGMRARFIPNDPLLASHSAQVTMVALTNVKQIDQLELANIFGGSVPATRGANGEPIPVTSQYPLLASLEVEEQASGEHFGINQSVAGVLLVQGDAESILHRFVNRIAQVLIRESGF